MDDLVGIAAQDKTVPGAEQVQNHIELGIGEVLDLVNHDKIILRLAKGQAALGLEIQIEEIVLVHVAPILLKQVIGGRAVFVGEDRAPHAEVEVVAATQVLLVHGPPGQHPVEFLEQLVAVLDRRRPPHPAEPAHKCAKRHLPAAGDINRFNEFAKGQEGHVLGIVAVVMTIVEIPCVLGQVGGKRGVEDIAMELLEFLENQGCFSAPRGTDDDEGRTHTEDGVLFVVERDNLIQEMEMPSLRVQETQGYNRRRPAGLRQFRGHKLVFVDLGTVQKPRLLVCMIADDFENQEDLLPLAGPDLEQQAVRIGEFGPVEPGPGHFFNFSRAEITGLELSEGLVDIPLHTLCHQLIMDQNTQTHPLYRLPPRFHPRLILRRSQAVTRNIACMQA